MNNRDASNRLFGTFCALAALALAASAWGDVVTYKNGRVVKGLIDRSNRDEETVRIETATTKLTIPRSRIQSVKHESTAQGYIHIGAEHRQRGKLPEALLAFERALQAESDNDTARALVESVQSQISAEKKMDRKEAVTRIDDLADEARALIEQGDFEEAEQMLKEANVLVPKDDQRAGLQWLLGELYLAWSDERQDKLDRLGAEQKLTLALGADPENPEVVNRLLQLWEDNPQERENAANVYETLLERNPEDNNIRKKLAGLYYKMGNSVDAVNHYMALYQQSEEYQGTELEGRLIEMLERLHKRYAADKNYEEAKKTYHLLATIDIEADPLGYLRYDYLMHSSKLAPDDYEGYLKLAQFAEQCGMDVEALKHYNLLLQVESIRGRAQAAINRYAAGAYDLASMFFERQNYTMAQTVAQRIKNEYPDSREVLEKVAELLGRAQAQVAKSMQQQSQLSERYVQWGDEYYGQAQFHFQNLFSTERKQNALLGSDKSEAKQYYSLARNSYQKAMELNPALGRDSTSPVNVRLRECNARLARLGRGAGRGLDNFGRPINTPQSSIRSFGR